MIFSSNKSRKNSVRRIIILGVFWRILVIEIILLVGTLLYEGLTANITYIELLWYALRILSLVAIIILFMMITLRSFLTKKIISPLEAIVKANQRQLEDATASQHIDLLDLPPKEISDIISTRNHMLDTILKISEERLRYQNLIRQTFGRYLSKKVVDEILTTPNGSKIGGRKENVTVMLSDIRGFTTLSENTDPEKLVQLLNRYLETMSQVIVKFDGMIDEFIGDAILTVFGVPEKREDHAQSAVACALTMQNRLETLNEEFIKDGYPTFEMGIGINTGLALVGNIGSEIRTKYGIVGPTINITSRIESNTIGGDVLIGETTFEQTKELITVAPPQTVMMKGMKSPLVFYSVTAMGPPYNIGIKNRLESGEGIKISLPFNYWKMEGKKGVGDVMQGETISMSDHLITASLDTPLDPLTDIKLIFNFCTTAHCFSDIYLKVKSLNDQQGKVINHLGITYIDQKDTLILKQWMADKSS